MALPADGQNANGLTKVTQIPAGKELMFIDPTTNEGGIITLEDLTKQILNGLASQAFALDAGQMTLPAALNYLYGKSLKKIQFKNSTASNSVIITKKDPYNPVVVIISNNGNLFFYIDSAFKGQIIVDNSYCSIERTSNKEFKVTNTGYGEALIFSSDNVTIN